MNGARTVIVAYRPKPGSEVALIDLVRSHHGRLLAEGLVTPRSPSIMRGAGGVIVEVFQWASPDAIAEAHENAAVQTLWAEFAAICDYVPVGELPEAGQLFSEFEAIEG